jgi:hypothetical protein
MIAPVLPLSAPRGDHRCAAAARAGWTWNGSPTGTTPRSQVVSSGQLFDLTLNHPSRGALSFTNDMVTVVGTDITICVPMPAG